ncbi:MAG: rRNA maturation RNase YbeY [Bacteroidia bacterium]|nr:rRNA maturation RNase YbeY [Bacteroidia bacterium]
MNFFTQDVPSPIENGDSVINCFTEIIKREDHKADEVIFIFCSDNYLLDLNIKYLSHDYFTDVISFDYSENNVISGDIFISVDRIRENAEKFNVTFQNELLRVMIHGLLHLFGYNDKTPAQKAAMTAKEDEYLKLLNV